MNQAAAASEPPSPGRQPIAVPREGGRRQGWRDLWRRLRRTGNGDGSVRDALEQLIERHEQDQTPINSAERVLLENTLRLRKVTVEDVCVPRADIAAVEAETSIDEVIAQMGRTHHSRLPVYRRDLDDVIGMLHIKDVLPYAGRSNSPPLSSIVHEVLFVAPSMRVLDLLLQMRLSRIHLALVVDEYGGIDGLVTIENLVEEIVGEIEDEHEIVRTPKMIVRPDGSLIADARVSLEDFEARIGPVLSADEREDVDTLGGLVFTLVGRVPTRGEIVPHPSGLEFEVLERDSRSLRRLRVRNLPNPPAAAA